MSRLAETPISDCHVHVNSICNIIDLMEVMSVCKFSDMNVLSLSRWRPSSITQNPLCLLFKAMNPDKIYAFGGINHFPPELPKKQWDLVVQGKNLLRMGFDGIKMYEGKPEIRKEFGEPLDSEVYDGFYDYLEHKQVPILYHLADPKSFWDPQLIPDSARKRGWFYGDGTYPKRQDFYNEAEGILQKFPGLKIIFAHFCFLSNDHNQASGFLEKWPNISFDLAPNGEMYVDFAAYPQKWRRFFVKYQDRILFGTDNGDWGLKIETNVPNRKKIEKYVSKVKMMRAFLETDQLIPSWGKGLNLEEKVFKKIYFLNFRRYVKGPPHSLDLGLATEEFGQMMEKPLEKEVKQQLQEIIEQLKDQSSSVRSVTMVKPSHTTTNSK